MNIEFYHQKGVTFREADYIIIDGNWLTYDKLNKQQVDTIFLMLFNIDRIRFYIKTIKARGTNDRLEQIRHAARHFFPLLNNTMDIEANGRVNIEMHK